MARGFGPPRLFDACRHPKLFRRTAGPLLGGNDGWWDLYDVAVGPDVIRAKYRLNGLNKPSVTIDRRSGRITVQGTASYGFRGTCEVAGGDGPRRF